MLLGQGAILDKLVMFLYNESNANYEWHYDNDFNILGNVIYLPMSIIALCNLSP